MGSTFSRWGAPDSPNGVFAKALALQDKLSGINVIDTSGRYTTAQGIARVLGDQIDKNFTSLRKGVQENLLRYGIDKDVWKLLGKAKSEMYLEKGERYLTPQIVESLSDEDIIKDFIKNKTGRTTPQKLANARHELYSRLLNFFSDQSHYGKTLPTVGDRAIMAQGIRKDTIPGQFWNLATFFRGFAFAGTRRTIGRLVLPHADSLYDAIFKGKADYSGIGKLAVAALPLGYMSYAAARS